MSFVLLLLLFFGGTYVCAVDCFECAKDLVDKVLAVVVRELLCADDPVKVGLHKFLNDCMKNMNSGPLCIIF
jgi:hypothetical protein